MPNVVEDLDLLYQTRYRHMDRAHFDYCARLADIAGLDLFTGECYASAEPDPRNEEETVPQLITGINGLRKIAHRTGEHAGSDAAVIERAEGGWPVSAAVTVYRMIGERRTAFTALVYMDERYPGEGVDKLWDRMPATNLERCAEAAALRKAFPNETIGIHTAEEMALGRKRREDGEKPTIVQPMPTTREKLEARLIRMGLTDRMKRIGVLAVLDQEFGHMGDTPERWANAFRSVTSHPEDYGLA